MGAWGAMARAVERRGAPVTGHAMAWGHVTAVARPPQHGCVTRCASHIGRLGRTARLGGWAYASQCWQANACVNRWAAATRPHTGTVSESVTCSGTHCGLPVQAAPSSLPLAAAATWGAVGHWQVHNGEGAHQAHHDDASHVAVTTGTVVVTLWVC